MAFRYGKSKKHDEGFQWAAYSDLFMALSTIFLLMYVMSSLRGGAAGVQTYREYQKLAAQNEDLKQQLKVYNTLKEDYLQTGGTKQEQEVYTNLMDKLDLLQSEAKDEKNRLREQAQENENKEKALNEYQQTIRNIMNANLVAQARIKKRDSIIVKKDDMIQQKKVAIRDLEKSVSEKQKLLAENEQKISTVNAQLEKRMKDLRNAYKYQQITKKQFEKMTTEIKVKSASEISLLKTKNENMASQLQDVSTKLQTVATSLDAAKSTIQSKDKELDEKRLQLAGQAAEMREQFEAERGKERAAFEAQLAKEKLSLAQRMARETEFKSRAEAKARDLEDNIRQLSQRVSDTEGALAKAQELANARKKLAQDMKANFAKAGLKADVDPGTGDVTINFADQYFDTGKAALKEGMRSQLEKTIPVYARSLFENTKIADKISSVEIVGFASPTFKGKVIDPRNLDTNSRQAVDYNLDLSYTRAKAIFQHIFDQEKMTFQHQKKLLPLVKVTGRSFLADSKDSRIPANASQTLREYCEKNDCKKAQRVIIKFNLSE